MHHQPRTDHGTRKDRLLREHVHDPYQTPGKLPEPTVCPDCGVVFQAGRWQWITPPPAGAHRMACQACRRIRDQYPAGLLTLRGGFVREHPAELRHLARHCEAEEKQAHPLHRIMGIEEQPEVITIRTTDIHLPHRIAEAIQHAYRGDLKIQYDEEGCFARVDWQRDA